MYMKAQLETRVQSQFYRLNGFDLRFLSIPHNDKQLCITWTLARKEALQIITNMNMAPKFIHYVLKGTFIRLVSQITR